MGQKNINRFINKYKYSDIFAGHQTYSLGLYCKEVGGGADVSLFKTNAGTQPKNEL